MEIVTKEISIKKIFFDGSRSFVSENQKRLLISKNKLSLVDFAYAMTCHKMQGSSCRKPIIVYEKMGNNDFMKKWLYTAVTRAIEKLILVK